MKNTPRTRFTRKLDDFMKSPQRVGWLVDREFSVYIRKSVRKIDGNACECLDLAAIEVAERAQGKGIFNMVVDVMKEAARKNGKSYILLELVHNRPFRDHIEQSPTWTAHPELERCFYSPVHELTSTEQWITQSKSNAAPAKEQVSM